MQALGTIEVIGLVAGIEAADVACKTADVELVGYELAKGGGYVTIKVIGQVGAVNAAVDAAASAAARITRVVSRLVIPRPNDQISPLICSAATVGCTPPPAEQPEADREQPPRDQQESETPADQPEADQEQPPRDQQESEPAPRTTTNRRKQS